MKKAKKKTIIQKTEEDKLSGQLSSLGFFFFINMSNFGIQALAKSRKARFGFGVIIIIMKWIIFSFDR